MINVTQLEMLVIKSFNTNYSCAKDEKEDNATYTTVKEISKAAGLDLNTVKGVVGSLVKKGLADVDTHKHGAPDVLVLLDDGIDILYK